MYIHKQRASLEKHLEKLRIKDYIIGFVPTMGALHEGHLSLIRKAKESCDIVVASVFVNPRQFNNREDFEKYPRVVFKDLNHLFYAGCSIVYVPDEEEVYKHHTAENFALENHTNLFEGASRPGHFNGMATVVKILFETVKPHKAFFGQKDYQQTLVIKWLNKEFKMGIELSICPTLRESSGLAMSSRNERLSAEERQKAAVIYRAMQHIAAKQSEQGVNEAAKMIGNAGLKLDYLELVDAETLEKKPSDKQIVLAAAYSGTVRLIDNLPLY